MKHFGNEINFIQGLNMRKGGLSRMIPKSWNE